MLAYNGRQFVTSVQTNIPTLNTTCGPNMTLSYVLLISFFSIGSKINMNNTGTSEVLEIFQIIILIGQ